jgi:hypothetical protein
MRITADGTPLDVATRLDLYGEPMLGGRVLQHNAGDVIDVALVSEGTHVVAVVEHSGWPNQGPLSGLFIASDGLILGSRRIAQGTTEPADGFTLLDPVRLPDGRLVAVTVSGYVAAITPVVTTPPILPRRRAERYSTTMFARSGCGYFMFNRLQLRPPQSSR